jgi:hypothetical protein
VVSADYPYWPTIEKHVREMVFSIAANSQTFNIILNECVKTANGKLVEYHHTEHGGNLKIVLPGHNPIFIVEDRTI